DTPGEGMGLPYVKALVRRHGGRIWFDSAPEIGTTFSFSIPYLTAPELTPPV
ncbi:MAG: ATP-binding protein, partial [Anaerolineae bacterium]|nr:ATP-binding protein [Anaerolineae bacterium]